MSPPALNLDSVLGKEKSKEDRGEVGRADNQVVNSGQALPGVKNSNISTKW